MERNSNSSNLPVSTADTDDSDRGAGNSNGHNCIQDDTEEAKKDTNEPSGVRLLNAAAALNGTGAA